MEDQILKTTLTVEFTAGETNIAADVLTLIAAARNGMPQNAPRAEIQANPWLYDVKPEAADRLDVTHDDIRDLMSEVIEDDEDNRPKVLKQLERIGAKSVGTIKDEHVPCFYVFLQSLKSA